MPRFEIDVDPCDHITADAIGAPGQRVFYLQAYQEQRTITVLIEKTQLHSLAIGIEQFLSQINQQNPDLEEVGGEFVEGQMRIHPPVDPLFRAGEIGLGYDKERDRVVIFAKELLTEEEDPESAAHIRFWATRNQMLVRLLESIRETLADVIREGRRRRLTTDQVQQVHTLHEAVVAAIIRGDPVTAGQAMEAHFDAIAMSVGVE